MRAFDSPRTILVTVFVHALPNLMTQPSSERNVSYTLWSRGRLIGHTDLAFTTDIEGARAGFFFPTETGASFVRIAVEASEILLAARDGTDRTTLMADLTAAADRCSALEFELRGPDGVVVATTDIGIRDTELLASWADLDDENVSSAELSPEEQCTFDTAVEHDLLVLQEARGDDWLARATDDGEWNEPEFPRYQIFVT
ncbi:MAG: hypothetical protein JWM95_2228 [Gemmatimonadetes bacterium]|nr:hypothetical protein [Gemmatimonadota bacterium]